MDGTLPTELGRLTSMKVLQVPLRSARPAAAPWAPHQPARLPGNVTAGARPAEFCRGIYGNSYSGSFPTELGRMTNLRHL